ncbi:MAG: hypothetical protein QOK29_4366, partial [Rhodospirillaceae bacterium]|nr:hypothetical protein [Rhodospirillaceae bacterium]
GGCGIGRAQVAEIDMGHDFPRFVIADAIDPPPARAPDRSGLAPFLGSPVVGLAGLDPMAA